MYFSKSAIRLMAVVIVVGVSASQLMAQQPTTTQETAVPRVLQFMQPTNTNDIRTSQLLGSPISYCGHVIDLLLKNQIRERMGADGAGEYQLPYMSVGMKPGDLELCCVNLVCDGHAGAGPVFQIGMRNNSCIPIGNFSVSVVGVLCQIHQHSPSATVCIERMEAGEELHVQVQLPLTCMCMNTSAEQAEFDTVVVALDSYDELLECNELNNIQILKRAEIGVLVADAPPLATAGVSPDLSTPVAAVSPEPTVAAPAEPQREVSPIDGLDLDQLDSATTQNQLFRSGR
ncbi:MAG: hypothetical protein WAO83_17470 [Fuerstiella sp.]